MKPWLALQVKPAGELCNSNCTYCYNSRSPEILKIMPQAVLDNLLKKYIKYSPQHLIFSWHGGEPTLAGLTFFKKMQSQLNRLKVPHQTITHMIQTNGTLLNYDFAKFFQQNDFKVSVSLDGPEKVHSLHRQLKNGKNSFSLTMRGIKELKKAGITPAVISTVSQKNYQFAKEILKFFIKQGLYNISFSPVVYTSGADDISLADSQWLHFLRDIFYTWCSFNNPKIQIREINEIIAWTLGKPLNLCSSGKACPHWMSVNPNGEVTACEYFNLGKSYGNILDTDFDDITRSPTYYQFNQNQSFINPRCQKCQFLPLCHNGCSRLRVKNGKFDLKGIYLYCHQRRQLYGEIKSYFDQIRSYARKEVIEDDN